MKYEKSIAPISRASKVQFTYLLKILVHQRHVHFADVRVIGSGLATPPESSKPQVPVAAEMVEALTAQVHEMEATEGLLSDWSLPGEHVAGAAYDLARSICRRAERAVVRLMESGAAVEPNILAYLNRLSDLLWLFGRKLELDAGVNGSLRDINGKPGPRWSRAW